jgi:hypothetical protein
MAFCTALPWIPGGRNRVQLVSAKSVFIYANSGPGEKSGYFPEESITNP